MNDSGLNTWYKRVMDLDLKVLAIGGSDPGGGAGIQQDIRTITVLGAYGTSIPTALTTQNTRGVEGVSPVDPNTLERQIVNCMGDISFQAIKIGMLGTHDNLKAVQRAFQTTPPPPVVVLDPVLSSKNHQSLLDARAADELLDRLAAYVSVITPNIPEAKGLLGLDPEKEISQEDLARGLHELLTKHGNRDVAVIVKGGHATRQGNSITDILVDATGVLVIEGTRIDTPHTHGTGCAYASCLATLLGGGLDIHLAMGICREFMEISLMASSKIGSGIGPVNTLAPYRQGLEQVFVLKALHEACSLLEGHPRAGLLAPEIQVNLGYALSYARGKGQVAAFPGRIVRIKERLARVKDPEFGASSHVANIILTAMKFDRGMRAAMDIRMDQRFLDKARGLGLTVAFFSRKHEPKHVKEQEGSSLVWGVKRAIEENDGRVPDLIWDDGDLGKEPAIRVLGRDPMDVAKKALSLI